MRRNILICTEEWAGSGHRMAAEALKQALEERTSQIDVHVMSGLRTVSPALQKISSKAYQTSLRHMPQVWEKLYQQERSWGRLIKRPLGKMLARRMIDRVIQEIRPDTVVATHAYCLSALSEAKRATGTSFILGSLPTDYYVNSFWVHPEVDFYVVAHQELIKQLQKQHNIPEEKICSYGIPIRPVFATNYMRSKSEWKQEIGLKPGVFTVLLTGGEDGHGQFLPLVKRLMQMGRPLQIVIITGRNAQLRQNVKASLQSDTSPHTVHILGYVEEMWSYMGAADVVISKPGGLTCSEALAMGTPLVIYKPLPGHEQRNSRFLQNIGAATEAYSLEEITKLINRWLTKKEEWTEAATRIQQHGKPDAAYQVADYILKLNNY